MSIPYTLRHHGAIDGVTGSCHQLLLADGRSILVDCGLFQGAETSADGGAAGQLEIGFPVEGIQALVLTHVHIDHVGRIPHLLAAGFRGPIICSEASAVLLPLVLEDALKVGFTPVSATEAEVELLDPEDGVSAGQACVFYATEGSRILGGGWIWRGR